MPPYKSLFLGACAVGYFATNYNTSYTTDIPSDFTKTKSMKIVNPNFKRFTSEIFSYEFDTKKSNEQVLASFTKGFFSGPSMFLERLILCTFLKGKGQITAFTSLNDIDFSAKKPLFIAPFAIFPEDKSRKIIWNSNEIPTNNLLQKGTLVYGTFNLIGCEKDSNSWSADFAFGSDVNQFSGFHRFKVIRTARDRVRVTFQGTICNPVEDADPPIQILRLIHYFYAKSLFNDAIRQMKS